MKHLGYGMTGMRQKYNKEFKIAVVTEFEGGKSLTQIAREHGSNPSIPSRFEMLQHSNSAYDIESLRLYYC